MLIRFWVYAMNIEDYRAQLEAVERAKAKGTVANYKRYFGYREIKYEVDCTAKKSRMLKSEEYLVTGVVKEKWQSSTQTFEKIKTGTLLQSLAKYVCFPK